MKRNIVLVAAIVTMFVFGLQIVEPVAAAKVVDQGNKKVYDGDLGWMKIAWTTYQYKKNSKTNNNFVKTHVKYYFKQPNGKYELREIQDITLAKTTKSTIKITIRALHPGEKPIGHPGVTYRTTNLTVAQYWWKEFRSEL